MFLCGTLFGFMPLTIESLKRHKSSQARDFMIWEFLQLSNISKEDAKKAYALVQNKNNIQIKKLYAKIVDDKVRFELECKQKKELLAINDAECLRYAFSLYKTFHLNKFERNKLLTRNLSVTQKKLLQLQNEPYTFQRYRLYDPRLVVAFLLTLPKKEFKKHFNKKLSKTSIAFLQQAPNFGRFVSYVVMRYDLEKLHRAFFDIDPKNLSSKTAFLLALNALRYGQNRYAVQLLRHGLKKAKNQREKDKISFWLYQATNDTSYLEDILFSMSINIYSLYAHEFFVVPIKNYFDKLSTNGKKSSFNLQNPFEWNRMLKNINQTKGNKLFKLAKEYHYDDLQPVQSFILEKAFRYKAHGYISPYDTYLQGLSINDKALIYAIMRQESAYIPSAISRSFALGLMQLMPFLVKHIAKKQNETIKRFDVMFDPQKNLKYAKIHLWWLKEVFKGNPLFIAYAYNGGYGFFTRYKAKKRFTNERYEPFMSMEMMPNSETREYGKSVLANYIMYKKIYGEPFSIIDFFETLR